MNDEKREEQLTNAKGLQRAIDVLTPTLELWRAGLEANGPDEFGGAIRPMVRSYAKAIGTLRVELDEIAGRPLWPRLAHEEDFAAHLETVDALKEQLKAATDPAERERLAADIETTEQHADAAMVAFAEE